VIVDTNALSAFFDAEAGVVRRFERADDIAVPVIVLGEYRFGLLGSRKRQVREEVLDRLVRAARVLEVTDATSRHYAAIRHDLRVAGTPIPVNDTWIAALARQHALPVLSNETHVDAVRNIRRIGW
jgi:predicted nucleic acid-binding protein